MSPCCKARVRRLVVCGAASLLISVWGWAEIQIQAPAGNPETASLARLIQDELAPNSPAAALDIRIAIGAEAFREALAQDDGRPLIGAYITSTEFEAALQGRKRPPHVTAVFSNPEPLDQVTLARTLLGRASLAVFDSTAAHSLAERVSREGVHTVPVAANQGIDSLLRAAAPFDAIIVLPDSTVLNRSNISHAVRTLYQRRKVLIGYSATLTQVGSLASVYVPPDAIARNVAGVLDRYASTAILPNPIFVRDVEVAINDRLARSLNIALPDRADLLEAIRARKPGQGASP